MEGKPRMQPRRISHLTLAALSLTVYASFVLCLGLAHNSNALLFFLLFFAYLGSSLALIVLAAKGWRTNKSILLHALPAAGLLFYIGYKTTIFLTGDIPD